MPEQIVFLYDPEKPKTDQMLLSEKIEIIKNSDFKVQKNDDDLERLLRDRMMETDDVGIQNSDNLVLFDLRNICDEIKKDMALLHSPNFTGRTQLDRPKKKRIEHFLNGTRDLPSGVKVYATRIGHCLDGLIKYAKYNPNLFGENNKNLKIGLRRYNEIIKVINSTSGIESANHLHSLLITVEFIFGRELQLVEEEEVSPQITAPSTSNAPDEFNE